MAGDQTEDDTRGPVDGDEPSSAEAKRRAARRRFLAGGAVALPLIVSVSRETNASWWWWDGDWQDDSKKGVNHSICVSMVMKFKDDKSKKTWTSIVCVKK